MGWRWLLVGLLVGCASETAPEKTPAAAREAGAVVGHVQLRNARVTISVAMDGPRFSVVSTEGVTLATRLPLDEFESRFPEMAPAVRWSVAIDASVDRQLLRERDGRQSEPAPLHGRLLNRLD